MLAQMAVFIPKPGLGRSETIQQCVDNNATTEQLR